MTRVYHLDDPEQAAAYDEHVTAVERHNRSRVGTHDGSVHRKLAERRRVRERIREFHRQRRRDAG